METAGLDHTSSADSKHVCGGKGGGGGEEGVVGGGEEMGVRKKTGQYWEHCRGCGGKFGRKNEGEESEGKA